MQAQRKAFLNPFGKTARKISHSALIIRALLLFSHKNIMTTKKRLEVLLLAQAIFQGINFNWENRD